MDLYYLASCSITVPAGVRAYRICKNKLVQKSLPVNKTNQQHKNYSDLMGKCTQQPSEIVGKAFLLKNNEMIALMPQMLLDKEPLTLN